MVCLSSTVALVFVSPKVTQAFKLLRFRSADLSHTFMGDANLHEKISTGVMVGE